MAGQELEPEDKGQGTERSRPATPEQGTAGPDKRRKEERTAGMWVCEPRNHESPELIGCSPGQGRETSGAQVAKKAEAKKPGKSETDPGAKRRGRPGVETESDQAHGVQDPGLRIGQQRHAGPAQGIPQRWQDSTP